MTTAYQLVTGALRLATVVAAGEQATAEDMADGIEALNQMAAALKIDGIDLQWVSVDSNTDLTLDDAYIKALKYLLAVDLAPEYGLTIAPAVIAQAEGGYRALQMAFTTVPDATFDTGIGKVGRKIVWNM
jgi:hypothetical protein